MVKPWRKRVLAIGVLLLIAGAFGAATLVVAAEQVIKITAKKFECNPQEITLKEGAPVALEFPPWTGCTASIARTRGCGPISNPARWPG